MRKIILLLVALIGALSTNTVLAIEGTFLLNPRDLNITNIRILAERPVGDRTEIEFTTDVQNTASGVYHDIIIDWILSNAVPSLTIVDTMLQFVALDSMQTAAGDASNTLIVSVLNTDLVAARAQILAGSILQLNAMEVPVYSGPSKYIDEAADNGFTGTIANIGMTVLSFSNNIPLITNLVRGDILLADPSSGGYRPRGSNTFNAPYLAQYIPFEVDSVVVVGDRTHVHGNQRDIEEVIRSGTFVGDTAHAYEGGRNPYDPVVENTYTAEEKAERALLAEVTRQADPRDEKLADLAGLNAIPIKFNKVRIGDAIDLSGEILLRSSGLKFEVTFRNFAIERAVAHIDAGLVANFVLETVGTNNNVAMPLFEKEVELLDISMPPVPINIAGVPMSLGANFYVKVGAEATAPGGLSIPIQSAIIVGAELGSDSGQPFAAPIHEFIPPRISDPTVFEAVTLTARAWAEAKFEMTLGDSLQLLRTGPSLAIRTEGSFTANPFANPWWNLDFGAELIGAFTLDFLSFNIARAETTFWEETFFHRDAGGPLIALPADLKDKKGDIAAAAAAPDLRPKSGANVRWGLALQPKPNQLGYADGFVIPLAGGDIFTAGSSALCSYFARFRADGTLVWCQNWNSIIETVAGAQLRDGRIAVLGKTGFDWFLAFYDTDGNRQSVRRYNSGNSLEITDMAVAYNAASEPSFVVVGYINTGTVRDSDPFIFKLNQVGDVVWGKTMTLPGDDEVYSVEVLRDGNYVLAGRTSADVGTDPLINILENGFIMKVSSEGDFLWANAVVSYWGMTFKDVVEGADGTLFAAGAQNDLVWNYYPDIALAKFSADGELQQHVLLGEDPDGVDELPMAGDTPYDSASQIVWTEDGLYVTGHTGLGANTAGWVAAITEELGVRWFSSFDGSRADEFADLAVAEDGLLVMGWSDSVMPFGTGGNHSMVLFKYPWEGIMRTHPDTGTEMKYLQPRTFLSMDHSHFNTIDNTNPLQPVSLRTAPVSGILWQALVSNESFSAVPTGVVVTPTVARLERIEPLSIDNFAEWAAYHQLSSANSALTNDFDGDGRPNAVEFFFGTNPHQVDSAVPEVRLERNGATLTAVLRYPLPPWATFPLRLEATSDLNSPFAPILNHVVSVDGELGGGLYGEVRHELTGQNAMFYRIGFEVP